MTSNVKSKNIPFSWGAFCRLLTGKNVDVSIFSCRQYVPPPKMVNEKEIDLIPPNVLESIVAHVDDFLSPHLLSSIVVETEQDRKFNEVLQLYDPFADPLG